MGRKEDSPDERFLQHTVDYLKKHIDDNGVYAVKSEVKEEPGEDKEMEDSQELPSHGIVFQIPPGKRLDKGSQNILKKLHCNLGHPSTRDLQRFMHNAGAKQELVEAVGWLQCTACAQTARPRLHRSTRMPPHDVQFNDDVLLDCFHMKDNKGDGFWSGRPCFIRWISSTIIPR